MDRDLIAAAGATTAPSLARQQSTTDMRVLGGSSLQRRDVPPSWGSPLDTLPTQEEDAADDDGGNDYRAAKGAGEAGQAVANEGQFRKTRSGSAAADRMETSRKHSAGGAAELGPQSSTAAVAPAPSSRDNSIILITPSTMGEEAAFAHAMAERRSSTAPVPYPLDITTPELTGTRPKETPLRYQQASQASTMTPQTVAAAASKDAALAAPDTSATTPLGYKPKASKTTANSRSSIHSADQADAEPAVQEMHQWRESHLEQPAPGSKEGAGKLQASAANDDTDEDEDMVEVDRAGKRKPRHQPLTENNDAEAEQAQDSTKAKRSLARSRPNTADRPPANTAASSKGRAKSADRSSAQLPAEEPSASGSSLSPSATSRAASTSDVSPQHRAASNKVQGQKAASLGKSLPAFPTLKSSQHRVSKHSQLGTLDFVEPSAPAARVVSSAAPAATASAPPSATEQPGAGQKKKKVSLADLRGARSRITRHDLLDSDEEDDDGLPQRRKLSRAILDSPQELPASRSTAAAAAVDAAADAAGLRHSAGSESLGLRPEADTELVASNVSSTLSTRRAPAPQMADANELARPTEARSNALSSGQQRVAQTAAAAAGTLAAAAAASAAGAEAAAGVQHSGSFRAGVPAGASSGNAGNRHAVGRETSGPSEDDMPHADGSRGSRSTVALPTNTRWHLKLVPRQVERQAKLTLVTTVCSEGGGAKILRRLMTRSLTFVSRYFFSFHFLPSTACGAADN